MNAARHIYLPISLMFLLLCIPRGRASAGTCTPINAETDWAVGSRGPFTAWMLLLEIVDGVEFSPYIIEGILMSSPTITSPA